VFPALLNQLTSQAYLYLVDFFSTPSSSPTSQFPITIANPANINMAVPSVVAAEMLPRFLLPRLSWGTPLSVSRATRPFASIPSSDQRRSFASIQAGPVPRRRSPAAESPIAKRAFHATTIRQRDHHFDTLKFVKRLQGEGFTEEQSAAMMKVLNDVIEER